MEVFEVDLDVEAKGRSGDDDATMTLKKRI